MPYQHGVRVLERDTNLVAAIKGTAGLQVVIGTAPVNLAENPTGVTNKPVIAYSWEEAVKQLGYSDDWTNYTLCQSMYASFKLAGVAPVIFINVLDPAKAAHKTEVSTAAAVDISNLQGVLEVKGVLKSTVVVKKNSTALTIGTDYTLDFDADGNLVITILATGSAASETSVNVTYTKLNPAGVTSADIIGATSGATETGLEVLRQVYPKFGMVPGLLVAPGWSKDADVAAVLQAKAEEINGLFRCEGFIDLSSATGGCLIYTDGKTKKDAAGLSSPHFAICWPCVKVGSKVMAYSALLAAMTAKLDAENDDVPYLSPSNMALPIAGACLENGTEVLLDQVQANALNGAGIITAINLNGWRSWGNNSAAYPGTTDPKDRWFCCRRFFSWWGNSFIQTYLQEVDNPADFRLIESIVDAENIRGNAYVSAGKCAAARMEFDESENSVTDILDGRITFHQHLAPFTPAEDIVNILEFDPEALAAAINGGE